MKKMLWCMLCLFLLITLMDFVSGAVRDKRNRQFTVSANTSTATMAGGYLPGRVYYLAINESSNYVIRIASWNLTGTDLLGISIGIPLNKNYGYWEDKYNVYQSSWWTIIQGGGVANVSPSSATVTYFERD